MSGGQESVSVLRLCVTAEADPGALARILERFQNLNILPRSVRADWGIADTVHVRVDVAGVPHEVLSRIASKLNQVPCVLHAHWQIV